MYKLTSIVVFIIVLCADIKAQSPEIVKDIWPGYGNGYADSETNGVEVGGIYYFGGNDGVHGVELWRSDGTEMGTYMVKDINPGAGSSVPSPLYKLGNKVYFFADDGEHGDEPWVSDGTELGTFLIKDINPGTERSVIKAIVEVKHSVASSGDYLYFPATNGVNKRQLYKTDGTENGTVLLTSFCCDSLQNLPQVADLVPFQNKIYFGYKGIWETDGTPAGTFLITEHDSQGIPVNLQFGKAIGDRIYFNSNYRIFSTDGTASGTVAITQDSFAPSFEEFIEFNNSVYFIGGLSLYKTNGTAAGTEKLIDTRPEILWYSDPNMYVWDNELYFQVEVPNDTTFLYKTNGEDGNFVKLLTMHDSPLYDLWKVSWASTDEFLYFDPVDLSSDLPAIGRIDKLGNIDIVPFGYSVLHLNIVGNNVLFRGGKSNGLGLELYKWHIQDVPTNEPIDNEFSVYLYPTITTNDDYCFTSKAEIIEDFDIEIIDLFGRKVFNTEGLKSGDCINPEISNGIFYIRYLKNGKFIKVQKLIRV